MNSREAQKIKLPLGRPYHSCRVIEEIESPLERKSISEGSDAEKMVPSGILDEASPVGACDKPDKEREAVHRDLDKLLEEEEKSVSDHGSSKELPSLQP